MKKYLAVGLVVGFLAGLIFPITFPSLIDIESNLYTDTEYRNFWGTARNSSKPPALGSVTILLCSLLGLFGGYLAYLVQNRK